jgi:DNA invertase Pin-like site-specific DNA recombinase
MIRIGYVRSRDAGSAAETAALRTIGCHVVRTEEPVGPRGDDRAVLDSILDFVGAGDELVVTRLDQLATTSRGRLEVIDRLERRGARLYVVEQQLCTKGAGGRALRAALEAVAAVEPMPIGARGSPARTHQIRALQRAGVGPVEIARRLGVSRMTVWRKLRALET